jgi:Spy/CpxP family protein refolding chaperone
MKQVVRIGLMVWLLFGAVGLPVALPLANSVSTASAQPAQDRRPNQARLQELREKVMEAKHRKLRETLALDDETAPKFFEHYRVAERDIQDLSKQRNEELKNLYRLMQGAGRDEQVDPAIERVRDLTDKIQRRQIDLDNQLKPILSPRQRAKLLTFEQEFNKRVKQHVQDARVGRGPKGGPDQERRRELEERIKRRLKNGGRGDDDGGPDGHGKGPKGRKK